tara:strand:- start:322 stop:558 length:237 start_codon:yes stop_codon:yes gene_type:complete
MNEENNDYSDSQEQQFKDNCGKIAQIIEDNFEILAEDERNAIDLCNRSLAYAMEVQDSDKAIWEVKNALNLLKNFLEF